MAQYRIGTATFTNGSATVTGTDTAWLANVNAGDMIVRQGNSGTTYQAYIVGGVTNDGELQLTAPYAGATATDVNYVIHSVYMPNGAPTWANGDVEFAAIQNEQNRRFLTTSSTSLLDFNGPTGSVIGTGYAFSATAAVFTLPVNLFNAPGSITVSSTFSINGTNGVAKVTGINSSSITLDPNSSNRVALLFIPSLTGLSAGETLTLRAENTSSKITVNP